MPDWIHEMEAVWNRYPRSLHLIIFSLFGLAFMMLGVTAALNLASGMFQPIVVAVVGAAWWLPLVFFCYMLFRALVWYLEDREKFFSHF